MKSNLLLMLSILFLQDYPFRSKSATGNSTWTFRKARKAMLAWWQTSWLLPVVRVLKARLDVVTFLPYEKRMSPATKYETDKNEAIRHLRALISRDIHDEIGSGLTKISLMSERLKIKLKSVYGNDEPLLNKIIAVSQEVAGDLCEIVWAINPDYDTVSCMLSYFREYTVRFLDDTDLNYCIDFPEPGLDAGFGAEIWSNRSGMQTEIATLKIHPDIKRNLFLVLKESLNNIVKHAAASNVNVHFRLDGRQFLFEISDDGKGIGNGHRPGRGLRNIQQRIESIIGKLIVVSGVNEGTKIMITGLLSEHKPSEKISLAS